MNPALIAALSQIILKLLDLAQDGATALSAQRQMVADGRDPSDAELDQLASDIRARAQSIQDAVATILDPPTTVP